MNRILSNVLTHTLYARFANDYVVASELDHEYQVTGQREIEFS